MRKGKKQLGIKTINLGINSRNVEKKKSSYPSYFLVFSHEITKACLAQFAFFQHNHCF